MCAMSRVEPRTIHRASNSTIGLAPTVSADPESLPWVTRPDRQIPVRGLDLALRPTRNWVYRVSGSTERSSCPVTWSMRAHPTRSRPPDMVGINPAFRETRAIRPSTPGRPGTDVPRLQSRESYGDLYRPGSTGHERCALCRYPAFARGPSAPDGTAWGSSSPVPACVGSTR